MFPQQHLYNGLARPADYLIFTQEWTRENGCAGLWPSWLAYDQRASRPQPARMVVRADAATGHTSGRTTGHRDGQDENIMPRCRKPETLRKRSVGGSVVRLRHENAAKISETSAPLAYSRMFCCWALHVNRAYTGVRRSSATPQ